MRTPLHALLLWEMHFMCTYATFNTLLTHTLVTKPPVRPHPRTRGVGLCLLHPIASAPLAGYQLLVVCEDNPPLGFNGGCSVKSDCSLFTPLLLGFILLSLKFSCCFFTFQFLCYCYFG